MKAVVYHQPYETEVEEAEEPRIELATKMALRPAA
jgi:hypothetical protein